MGVTTTKTNKPLNPRGNDQSPLAYNRAKLYSGKALDFDGVNDYVDLDGFTMAGNVATIVFQAKFENDNYLLDLNPQRFVIRNTSSEGFRVFNSDSFAEYGETKRSELGFYSIVSDGTTQRAYYNGVQLGSDKTIIALDWSSATNVKIASNNTGTNNFFDGQLSNFKIFNTALTAAQVADLYNNPEKVVPTGVDNTALKLWLPMMEGAGTTAYDGSGNGNHGTISGATYVNGVGAPVAQSAVMDWNKGTNRMIYSEQFDNAAWLKAATILTANDTTAPDGSQTADKIEFTASGAEIYDQFINVANSLHIGSVFLKNDDIGSVQVEIIGGGPVILGQTTIDLTDGSLSASVGDYTPVATDEGNGWYRVSVGDTGETTIATPALKIKRVGSNGSFYAWGAQVEASDSLGAYIPNHTGTPITSPVLLPQGLTTGRDITGVNLFENVRKQGALNLDGNSWAEVHDNASLDITSAITLEAWVYYDGSNGKGLLGRWSTGSDNNYLLYTSTSSIGQFYINTTAASVINTSTLTTGNWYHLVGTYDGSDMRIYLNGSEETNTSKTGSISTSSNDIEIGRYSINSTYAYSDQIAQPRIYNRALTAEEVQRNYNAGKNIYK